MKRRHTKQRQAILDYVKRSHNHPNAEEVHKGLMREYPELGLATVYRNLIILIETGELKKVCARKTADCYDGNLEPHQHLLCEKCDRIVDIHTELEKMIEKEIENKYEHEIYRTEIVFDGVCKGCR